MKVKTLILGKELRNMPAFGLSCTISSKSFGLREADVVCVPCPSPSTHSGCQPRCSGQPHASCLRASPVCPGAALLFHLRALSKAWQKVAWPRASPPRVLIIDRCVTNHPNTERFQTTPIIYLLMILQSGGGKAGLSSTWPPAGAGMAKMVPWLGSFSVPVPSPCG